jgi:23S rRNA (cytidine1920-2'-O)/16S rRNA (cytidine1409-2'-O)-methyltransferase
MNKSRLDQELVARRLVASRSQAESWIKLGKVSVDGRVVTKPGVFVSGQSKIKFSADEQYVSRAGLKLASVASVLGLDFKDRLVLDVGSSTGGFTDYALQHGAKKVIAVDVGTEQLHPSLRGNSKIDLREKTDIRNVVLDDGRLTMDDGEERRKSIVQRLPSVPDTILIDVSFISLRDILPHIAQHIANSGTSVVAMVKPQFEAGKVQVSKGVVKNDTVRRQILKDFEAWAKQHFLIINKADSEVAGAHGNRERFYLLQRAKKR